MRIHYGPGYRPCFPQSGAQRYWLLCGGNKAEQRGDILRAKTIKSEIEEADNGDS